MVMVPNFWPTQAAFRVPETLFTHLDARLAILRTCRLTASIVPSSLFRFEAEWTRKRNQICLKCPVYLRSPSMAPACLSHQMIQPISNINHAFKDSFASVF